MAISSLDQYFANLTAITAKNDIFGALPLDEPTFDIDANSRQITVPDEFKKNGISVQGDQVSEILFFTIDRYVDAVDLINENMHIVIQWETAPDTSSKTAKSEKGISLAYIKDKTMLADQGKILFGWALNDTITQTAGTIKFAVRFYMLNAKQEISYSFSTLTAQATINPGLNYTWEAGNFIENVYDDSTLIRSRIVDSVQPVISDEVAATPEFLENYDLDRYKEFVLSLAQKDETVVEYNAVDLVDEGKADDNGNALIQLDFIVQAGIPKDAGDVSYKWTRLDLTTGNSLPLGTDSGVSTKYIPTNDTTFNGSKLYYKKTESDGYEVYARVKGTADEAIPEETLDAGLYEEVSVCSVTHVNGQTSDVTGLYTVTLTNKHGIAQPATLSQTIWVPGPDKDTFTLELPEGASTQVYLSDGNDGAGTAILKAVGQTARITDTEANIKGDTVVYSWTEGDTVVGTYKGESTESTTPSTYTIVDVPAEERAKFDKTYEVSAYATRNGEKSETKTISYRVTDAAHAPVVSMKILSANDSTEIGTNNQYNFTYSKVGNIACRFVATIENFDDIVSDKYEYKWYKYNSDASGFSIDNDMQLVCTPVDTGCMIVSEDKKTCEFVFRPEHLITEGKFASSTEMSGIYFCVITNKLNGSENDNLAALAALEDIDNNAAVIHLTVNN